MLSTREKAILDLENTLEGLAQIHVWRGNPSPWMHIVAVEFGAKIDPEQELLTAGFSKTFIEDTSMQYDGVMPLDEVQERLELLRSYTEN